MRRRQWLQLGAGAAIVLATAGGIATFVRPGLVDGKLSAQARDVFARTGEAILDGSLPRGAARTASMQGFLERVEVLIGQLPAHAQGELSQLLALLWTTPGRIALAGLQQEWTAATVEQVQGALQSMRMSTSTLRRQAYHALHDISGAAYFADPSTWSLLGYPGQREV